MTKKEYKKVNGKIMGNRLKASRIEAGFTQTTAADAMDMNQSEVAIYESGRRIPKDETLQKISKFYNTTVEWLKYGDESTFDIEENESGTVFVLNHVLGAEKHSKQEVMKELKKLKTEDAMNCAYEMIHALYVNESDENYTKWVDDQTRKDKKKVEKAKDLINIKGLFPEEYKKYESNKISYEELVDIAKKKFAKNEKI